ncbi:MAG: hypothetical protein EF813_05735 [Methanosarcinales archaeon]|nr:MAG: hypothetical protein EF813_05735 [Methanosarcinales archaeon]
MELIEKELKNVVEVLRKWDIFRIEYKRAFIRGDGLPMLYVKAKSDKYYVHIEGIIKEQELKCYIKLTEDNKNKHSHKDEIIGWDNLYEDRPHIHFNEDEKREYREDEISWDEIKETIIKIMREGE